MAWITNRYRPAVETALGIFDNYQIYDVVFCKLQSNAAITTYSVGSTFWIYENTAYTEVNSLVFPEPTYDGGRFGNGYIFLAENGTNPKTYRYGSFQNFVGRIDAVTAGSAINSVLNNSENGKIYALQRYHPKGVVNAGTIETLLDELPPIPANRGIADIVRASASYPNQWETDSAGWQVGIRPRTWEDLIINHRLKYSGIAQTTGIFELNYWGVNPMEGHPLIDQTLNFYRKQVRLIEGKPFSFELLYPVAHTLEISPALLAATTTTGLALADILASNRVYLGNLPPLADGGSPPALPPLSGFMAENWIKQFWILPKPSSPTQTTSGGDPLTGTWIQKTSVYNYQWQGYRVLRADNMGIVPSTWGSASTPSDIPTSAYQEQFGWHFAPQGNNQFGSIIMDSPLILQMAEKIERLEIALDAEKFAVNDIDPNRPRVTTLGYWIEKCGNLLGHRPNADGKINHEVERANFARQRIERPVWADGQYSLNQFGSRGMVIPHLPNTYTGSGKLAKLYDVVYDLPQLLQALHDQVDIAQGIQHASQIRVKHSDGSIQAFPDLLSVQIETLKIAASMRECVARNQISAAVTGAEVRELFSAIGAPTAQKYLTFKDSVAGKVNQVPYFGHQQGKESITAGISTLKINMAIVLGVLMPKVQPSNNKLNPFQVLKKKA